MLCYVMLYYVCSYVVFLHHYISFFSVFFFVIGYEFIKKYELLPAETDLLLFWL